MTITEMHEHIDLLLDKAEAPWFNPNEKDKFINLALMEFTETRYNQFEFKERRREELLPLVRTFTVSGQSNVNINAIPDFLFILNVSGKWEDSCEPSGFRDRAINPVSLDKWRDSQEDPFNVNDNTNPGYIQRHNGTNDLLEILSDTDPTSIEINYLKLPGKVDSVNDISSDLPIATHEEIVHIAVRKMMATIEDTDYQVHINEINNQE